MRKRRTRLTEEAKGKEKDTGTTAAYWGRCLSIGDISAIPVFPHWLLWVLIFMEGIYIWGTNGSFQEIGEETIRWIFVFLNTSAFFELISFAVNRSWSFKRDPSSKKTDDDVAEY